MKANTKRRSLLTGILLAATLYFSAFALDNVYSGKSPIAETKSTGAANTYYYAELKSSELAQKFYKLFDEMAARGDFKKGAEMYDLSSVVSEDEIVGYVVRKEPRIPVAFGAARDTYMMDHPELFYADLYKLQVTAGLQDGKYVMYMGAGMADNFYADNTFTAAAQIDAAQAEFDREVDAAVKAAKANNADVIQQIKNLNKYIIEHTSYDYSYGATKASDGTVTYNGHIYTAYGAIVQNKAVCSGFSRAYKAVMDELGIPCVLVSGSACSGDSVTVGGEILQAGYEPHMWNAVEIDGIWYAVDVTYNSGKSRIDPETYMLKGADFMGRDHIEDPVVSTSGFELKYPALRPLDYGDKVDRWGFEIKDSGEIDWCDFGYSDNGFLTLGISYDDKNAIQLREEGKYLLVRPGQDKQWVSMSAISDFYKEAATGEDYVAGKYSVMSLSAETQSVQFAITSVAPDCDVENYLGELPLKNGGYTNLTDNQISAVSSVYANKNYNNVTYPPYIKSMRPNDKGYIMSLDPVDITITYTEKLVYEKYNDTTVGVTATAEVGEAKSVVKNVKWNEETNTLSFNFTPSQSYAHNCAAYSFVPTNLIGEKSRLAPEAGRLAFKMEEIVCPKVFNDGRLFMKVFGQPKLVSASDESLNEFKGKNGQPIVGDQRSQLMLVVSSPSKAESDAMMDAAQDRLGIRDGEIKASSTYQIDFQMCGKVQKVPTGSFMQVGFGFPEGFGPEDEEVTFTVYHYTRKADGTIDKVEPVPCVITHLGIMATVKSFSPFMICAVDAKSDAVKTSDKSVYAYVDGVGGRIDNAEIRTVVSGDSVSYTITPDSNYKLDRVLLNGTDVKSKVSNGNLTLSYAELTGYKVGNNQNVNNNVLEVSFISERAENFISTNNIRVIQPAIVVRDADMIIAVEPSASEISGGTFRPAGNPQTPDNNSKTGLIVGIIIALAIVLIGGGLAILSVLREKKETETNSSAVNKKSTSTKSTVAKSITAQPTAKPTAERTTTAQQTAARPVAARSTADRTTAGRPATARPTTAQPTPTRTTADRSTAARQTTVQSTVTRPTAARPNADRSTTRSATARPTTERTSRTTNTNNTANAARPQNRNTDPRNGKK